MMNYLNFDVKYQTPSCSQCLRFGSLGGSHFQTASLGRINITDIDDKIILRARQNKLFSLFCEALVSYLCFGSRPNMFKDCRKISHILNHSSSSSPVAHPMCFMRFHAQEAASLSLPDLSKKVNEASAAGSAA